jgi:uncharacterized protein YbaP (TraB family)
MRRIPPRVASILLGLSYSLQPIAYSPAAAAEPAATQRHSLWSLEGQRNTIYLLGSVHFLSPSEKLPRAMDAAYEDAEALVMEIDMDDLDPLEMQQVALELGMLPAGETLERQLGVETYGAVAAKAREIGIEPAMLDRFRPWFAALTLVQLHLIKMGLDPTAGVEQRLTARAASDGKPITGFESLREQLGILASLPAPQQREFLMYSVEDTEKATKEIETMLAAWRNGDVSALDKLLAEGMEKYPKVYRPLTVERNRKWIASIEQLLDDKDDYLVVVGTLHLVGDGSVIELLEKKGHKITQH